MADGDIAECQGRPQCDPGGRIITAEQRRRIVADCIKAFHRRPRNAQHAGMFVGRQSGEGSDIGRPDPQRVLSPVLDAGFIVWSAEPFCPSSPPPSVGIGGIDTTSLP